MPPSHATIAGTSGAAGWSCHRKDCSHPPASSSSLPKRRRTEQFLGFRAFAAPEIQKALQLTEKQNEEIQKIAESLRRELAESMGNFQEVMAKAQSLDRAEVDKVVARLTDEQKSKWQALTGARFEFKLEKARIPGGEPER